MSQKERLQEEWLNMRIEKKNYTKDIRIGKEGRGINHKR